MARRPPRICIQIDSSLVAKVTLDNTHVVSMQRSGMIGLRSGSDVIIVRLSHTVPEALLLILDSTVVLTGKKGLLKTTTGALPSLLSHMQVFNGSERHLVWMVSTEVSQPVVLSWLPHPCRDSHGHVPE